MSLGINRKRLLDELEKALNINELSVFIGAGLSQSAGHFNWKELLKKPARELELDINNEYDLVSLAQYYCNEQGRREIDRLISDSFPKTLPTNKNFEILSQLPIDNYWTTNYDKLIEDTLVKNNRDPLVITKDEQMHLQSRSRDAIVYKMHGDIENPGEAVLTKDDYERYGITDRILFRDVLTGQLISNTFLFLGFSFYDPNFNFVLGKLNTITDKKIRPHYYITKKIKRENYTEDEEFNYDRIKQELFINDLKKRYNIFTHLVDSYDQITSVLEDLYKRYRKRTIFISGSAETYAPLEKEEAQKLINNLSKKLVSKGYNIVNGYGVGVGSYVISGVTDYCYSNENRNISDYLTLMPFPFYSDNKEDLIETWIKYREEMISKAGIAVFMFGNKKENDKIVLADGMKDEYTISVKNDLDIISLGFTGSMAQEISKLESKDIVKIDTIINIEDALDQIIEEIEKL